jgi:hypothetical protein
LIGEGGNLFGLTTATGRAKRGDRLRDCWMMWVATFPEKGGRWLKSEPEDAEISLSGGNNVIGREHHERRHVLCRIGRRAVMIHASKSMKAATSPMKAGNIGVLS